MFRRILNPMDQIKTMAGLIPVLFILLNACSRVSGRIVEQDQDHWIVLNIGEAKQVGVNIGINGYALEVILKN